MRHPSRRRQILAGYRRLGVPEVRRHRLHLQSGKLGEAAPDLIAAFSELVGHDCYPGLWCLAPWRRDGHPDHDAVGLAAEVVCQSYNLRLVRYLCTAWEWLQPGTCRGAASASSCCRTTCEHARTPRWLSPAGIPGRAWVADRELFLV